MFELPMPPQSAYILVQAAPPFATLLAGIIRFPVDQRSLSYAELICTEQDRKNVHELISTIAENNEFTLWNKESRLRELGDQVNLRIHPLKFLSVIFTSPHLKNCMATILNTIFKRSQVLQGISDNLTREVQKGTLNKYLDDFAAELGVPPYKIREYTDASNWEGLVIYLTHTPTKP